MAATTTYACMYCGANFPTYEQAEIHEQTCSRNPQCVPVAGSAEKGKVAP